MESDLSFHSIILGDAGQQTEGSKCGGRKATVIAKSCAGHWKLTNRSGNPSSAAINFVVLLILFWCLVKNVHCASHPQNTWSGESGLWLLKICLLSTP